MPVTTSTCSIWRSWMSTGCPSRVWRAPPFYNNAVGGVRNSQHILGEAADICVMNDNQNENEKLAQIIEANGKYDQLIRYMGEGGKIRFIHVSWKRLGPNRKQIIYK